MASDPTPPHSAGRSLAGVILSAALTLSTPVAAAVSDLTVADVTTRSLSVVWVSDEAVSQATVSVFSDAAGTTEITSGLSVTLVSSAFPPALTQGVVKVDISGLPPDTCVYLQTATTGTSLVLEPPAPPFLEACTALETTRGNALGQPIANDVIRHTFLGPDGASAASGALLLLSVPSVGAAPLSAFAGQDSTPPGALVDLNNLFDVQTGVSAEVLGGEVMTLTELRGLACPALEDQRRLRFRRAPAHEEQASVTQPITEIEDAVPCFFADTVCDGVVNILDAQRVLNFLGATRGECAFNEDLDVVADDDINILDVQSVLNRLGESEPFPP
ncbi:MAG: hypothetical protein ACE5FG_14140 [Myxococcota bacterium]